MVRHFWILAVAAAFGFDGFAAEVTRVSAALWDTERLSAAPRTWEVSDAGIANDYGRVAGVNPIWIEGEPFAGKPTRVFAWWGLPAGASPAAKVPAMVLVHGGGGTAFAQWVKTWTDRGYAAVAMDTCGKTPRGERDGQPHPTHDWSGPAGWGESGAHVDDPIRDQWTYHAIAAILRSHAFIRTRPEVDPARTGLTGISWGGYLASIAMCVDKRFSFAAPVYGCGFYDLNPLWGEISADPRKLRRWFDLWDPKNYLSPAGGGAKCPVLWCDGTNDRFYRLDMLRKSYSLLDPSVPLMLSIKLRMPHGHPPAGDPKEITVWADHYLKGTPKPPTFDSTRVADGRLTATFSSGGAKVVKAEFLWTSDTNPVHMDRAWFVRPADLFEPGKGRCEAAVPSDAVMFFMNLVTDDGCVFSTHTFEPGAK